MPGIILTDCKILLGGYNLSGYHNSINLEHGAEMLDDTVFGTSGTRSNKPGMKTVSVSGNGFWDDVVDEALYNRIGAVREVMTLAPEGNAEGDRAFILRAVNGTYNPLTGEVGQLVAFDLDARASNAPLVRGVVMALGSKAADGNSVGIDLGLLAAGKRAYSGIHITASAAGTIQIIVESDDGAGFGSPTTRLTHTLFTSTGTEVGADWQELAGPVATDTFWRSKWTITGGPFTIYHVFGIQ